eukprot:COSAG06_NODE_886_length_11771_cov_13.431203_17_plen_183_part_00
MCADDPHYDRLLHGQTAAFVKQKRDEALAARQRRFSAPGAVRRHRSEEKKAATKPAAASDASTWPAVFLAAAPGAAGAAAAGGGKRGAPTASAQKLLATAEPQQIIEAFLAEHDPSYQRPSSVTSGGRQSSAVYRRLWAECEVPAPGNICAMPLKFTLGGRPVLSARLNVDTARSERKRPEI